LCNLRGRPRLAENLHLVHRDDRRAAGT